MGLVVNSNITSLLAQQNLRRNTHELDKSMERMSTGSKINNSADDAAGLAISKIFDTQINGILRATSNAQDGSNLLQIAESSLSIISDDLQRIRELAIQSGNATNSLSEKTAITQEIRSRITNINTVAENTLFNGVSLLGLSAPTVTAGYRFTIGPSTSDVLDVASALGNARATALNASLSANIDLTTFSDANVATFISNLDSALSNVSAKRSRLGAMQTQIETVIDNLQVKNINISSARSRIKDVDIPKESAEMVKRQILRNASVSVLTQANNVPKLILGLLQK